MMRSFIIYRLIDYCIERLATEIEYKICGIPYWDIVVGGKYSYLRCHDGIREITCHDVIINSCDGIYLSITCVYFSIRNLVLFGNNKDVVKYQCTDGGTPRI